MIEIWIEKYMEPMLFVDGLRIEMNKKDCEDIRKIIDGYIDLAIDIGKEK